MFSEHHLVRDSTEQHSFVHIVVALSQDRTRGYERVCHECSLSPCAISPGAHKFAISLLRAKHTNPQRLLFCAEELIKVTEDMGALLNPQGEWAPWTPCSVSCGEGWTTRRKICYGRHLDKCSGPMWDIQRCRKHRRCVRKHLNVQNSHLTEQSSLVCELFLRGLSAKQFVFALNCHEMAIRTQQSPRSVDLFRRTQTIPWFERWVASISEDHVCV